MRASATYLANMPTHLSAVLHEVDSALVLPDVALGLGAAQAPYAAVFFSVAAAQASVRRTTVPTSSPSFSFSGESASEPTKTDSSSSSSVPTLSAQGGEAEPDGSLDRYAIA